jgi:transglutaminase-like putative cysteine protease
MIGARSVPLLQQALAIYLVVIILSAPAAAQAPQPDAKNPTQAVYDVHHALTVKDIPEGSKKVRIWFWFPDDSPDQKVLQTAVPLAPSNYKITRDPVNGHRYLYAELDNPPKSVSLATHFVVCRWATSVKLDPDKAGPITAAHRKLFAEYLGKDCPCMQVDDRIEKLAQSLCGGETNVVRQARKLFDWVVTNTAHYSKSKDAPKNSGEGSALYCLNSKGGGCTDQHALFIALARARGIPTRLQFGSRLMPQNDGKDHNPGYRCWVQYFVPNYGWVSADLAAANTNPGKEDFYFSGLDERRVWFLEGRDLELSPRQTGDRVNLLIVAHIEVDGRPHTAFERNVRFTTVK